MTGPLESEHYLDVKHVDAIREAVLALRPRIVESLPDGALRSVSLRRTGLGEVFLELTGHELEDEPGGGS